MTHLFIINIILVISSTQKNKLFLKPMNVCKYCITRNNKSREEHHKEVAPDSKLQEILMLRSFNISTQLFLFQINIWKSPKIWTKIWRRDLVKLQHALNSLEISFLIKQESLLWAMLRKFYNQLSIITTSCFIN